MAIALYPGSFKPPHRGHYEAVKRLLSGQHGGVLYNLDNYKEVGSEKKKGKVSKVDPITKVIIFIGGGIRNGLTAEEAKKIWDIYLKHLSNVEVITGTTNPMSASNVYAKEHPNEKFYAVTGFRDEEDTVDLRRVSTYKNRDNVEALAISGDEKGTRASNLRLALLGGNLDDVLDFFPDDLSRQEILTIINMLKQSIITENMMNSVNATLDTMFKAEIKEASGGTPISPRSAIASSVRTELEHLYSDLRNQLKGQPFNVVFDQDRITIKPDQGDGTQPFDYTPYMTSILEFMVKNKKMKITPLPEIKIRRDLKESSNLFGKTAYYDPGIKEVVLYVEGRHPKDVLRSFVHEMIHHNQNLEGRLGTYQTTNTNEDDQLKEIEQEAHYGGSMIFREWEDISKN